MALALHRHNARVPLNRRRHARHVRERHRRRLRFGLLVFIRRCRQVLGVLRLCLNAEEIFRETCRHNGRKLVSPSEAHDVVACFHVHDKWFRRVLVRTTALLKTVRSPLVLLTKGHDHHIVDHDG